MFTTASPAPALQPYIARYWSLRATFARSETITLLPDGGAHLVLSRGDGTRSRRFGSLYEGGGEHLVGAMLSADEQALAGEQWMIGVSFHPAGLARFYRGSMRDLAGHVQPFEEAVPLGARALDRYFLERLRTPSSDLTAVLEDIKASNGNLRMDWLLKRHAMTARSLERYFDEQVGITPKELIALTRFKHALAVIERGRHGRSLMEVAWDCGYYDNAHLTREFKRFLGEAPSRVVLSDLSKSASG